MPSRKKRNPLAYGPPVTPVSSVRGPARNSIPNMPTLLNQAMHAARIAPGKNVKLEQVDKKYELTEAQEKSMVRFHHHENAPDFRIIMCVAPGAAWISGAAYVVDGFLINQKTKMTKRISVEAKSIETVRTKDTNAYLVFHFFAAPGAYFFEVPQLKTKLTVNVYPVGSLVSPTSFSPGTYYNIKYCPKFDVDFKRPDVVSALYEENVVAPRKAPREPSPKGFDESK
ncbi:hypothetical protein Micbo1qcDRAFT_177146 [Microdochium bolleyi]|uniref:Uncharacterized protein n=1 Tax=Microdochium bolleyi TaxID=196109 RepID=A0A136IX01_9PEZI|nr:hypothetical protein Micbo1qcDRAFT_177146 [Microdochium bolleyi]